MAKKKFIPTDYLTPNPDSTHIDSTPKTEQHSASVSYSVQSTIEQDIEEVTQRIEASAIDIAPNYSDWRDLGFSLADALGESGRSYYQRLSRFYPNYAAAETDKQFSACLKAHGNGITIKTLFHLAKQAGVSISKSNIERTVKNVSAISPVSPPEETEETADFEPMPTFSQDVEHQLPTLLSQIVSKANSPEDADLLLLGALTVFSACLPNVYGYYRNVKVYSNLFLFVTAQASAGKGRLSLCRHLVQPIHENLRKIYDTEMEKYNRLQMEYQQDRKNNEPPQLPPFKTLLIPANSSATSVYQVLNDNNGVGLMFETEGDTLANTFKSDYGNFSDGFRKAFHHEMISYNRRKDREFVELKTPRLSAVLSGTPQQVLSLIPDAENGLFSRFIFYYMNMRLEWLDVFAGNEESLDEYFEQLGQDFYAIYRILQSAQPIRFAFSVSQQKQFNTFFEHAQMEYFQQLGGDIVASVRRIGLITFRIAMILTMLRIDEDGDISELKVCSDVDFQTAITMARVLIQHTVKVFDILPPSQNAMPINGSEALRQTFLDSLPSQFSRQDYLVVAQRLNIPAKTAEKYIGRFCTQKKLLRLAQGKYVKS